MLKKIFMVIGVLAIVGVIAVFGSVYYIGDKVKGEELAEMNKAIKELDKDPEILQAKINFGRSAVAMFIIDNENIRKDLSAENLQKFQAEKDEFEVRHLEYKKLTEAYKLKLKQNQTEK